MKPIQAPTVEPLIVSSSEESTVSIPQTYTEYRDAAIANAAEIAAVTYPNEEAFQVVVDTLRPLSEIRKQVTDMEEKLRKPKNKWLKDIRAMRDAFLAATEAPFNRLTGYINHYQGKRKEEDAARERKALADKAAADRLAEQAERDRIAAEQEAAKASTPEAKEAAEEKLLEAELAKEEAALVTQSAEAALAVPTNNPKGLTTRVRYDFEIVNYKAFFESEPVFWMWKKDDEAIKLDRAALLKELKDDGGAWADRRPAEGQQSVTHPKIGIRVFRDVSASVK